MSSRCRILAWDSEFFGRRVARLTGPHLHESEVKDILTWCRAERVECLCFLAASDCRDTVAVAERHGFGWKDLRVTYERKCAPYPAPKFIATVNVRPHLEADLLVLTGIARSAHTDSRFFFDTRFDRERAAELYARWIHEACANDHVFVAESAGQPVGYLSCESSGQIGLFGVAPDFQGRGIGRALLDAGLGWFAEHGVDDLFVVTQGRNVAAQRFYQSAGFRTRSVECWFHKWFDP